tara:strand:+ start:531 stop:713 length:183 start_codon:yes stop_codon:yes gene_type:complete
MKVLHQNPSLSVELLDFLKELFPDRLPNDQATLEDLRYLQGQQSVIRKLDELYNENLFEE